MGTTVNASATGNTVVIVQRHGAAGLLFEVCDGKVSVQVQAPSRPLPRPPGVRRPLPLMSLR